MITLIILIYLFMALWISFGELKENKPKEAFKTGFLFPLLLTIVVAGMLGLLVFGAAVLIGILCGGAWIVSHMP